MSYFWQLAINPKFNSFLWICWFLCKNLSDFVPPAWKLHNLYCHRVIKPADLWDITFCTRWFWGFQYYVHPLILRPRAVFHRTDCTRRSKILTHALICINDDHTCAKSLNMMLSWPIFWTIPLISCSLCCTNRLLSCKNIWFFSLHCLSRASAKGSTSSTSSRSKNWADFSSLACKPVGYISNLEGAIQEVRGF